MATTQTTVSGHMDLIEYDMVRVTTERHTSEALFREDRVLFERNELIRLVAQHGDVCFAVPYLLDPVAGRREAHYIMLRQFRELNPAERASLGLSLHGNWDAVTRYGLAGARRAALAHAEAHETHRPDGKWRRGTKCREEDVTPDPKLDPRKFTIGVLATRHLTAGQQPAARDLHPWPVVAAVSERRRGGGEADWWPTTVRGRPGLAVPPDEARALVAAAELHQAQAVAAAWGRDETYVPLEYRVTYTVTLPEPYEPAAVPGPAAPRSIRFRVSRRTLNIGYVFVPPDAKPSPWKAAMTIAASHDDGDGGMECYNEEPSDESPSNCVCVYETRPNTADE